MFTANDGKADSPTYTVTLTAAYCYLITSNVTWATDVTSTTAPFLKLPTGIDANYSVVYGTSQSFLVSNYAGLTNGMMLVSIEVDGLVIPRSQFEQYTSLTAIDTSGCPNLGGRTVRIRMYKGNPQINFLSNSGYVRGNIEIKYTFAVPTYTPAVTVATGDADKGTIASVFAENTENGSSWTVTATPSNADLYYFDYVEDASGNKTYSTNGDPVTIDVASAGAAYTAHFADVAPNFTPTVTASDSEKGSVTPTFVKNTGSASSTWTVTATPAGWYKLSYVEDASGNKTYSSDGAAVTLELTADACYTAYFAAAVTPRYNETDADSVTVYVTVSNDGMPIMGNDENNTVLSRIKVTVPYFDLSLYGLSDFYRYGTEDGFGRYANENIVKRPTALHLYIYLLERYYLGLPEDQCGKGTSGVLNYNQSTDVKYMDGTTAYTSSRRNALLISGSPTSLYMSNFWGHDENLMYYVNHAYPLMGPGWGSTADYILLSDGDDVDVAMFTDWDFYTHGAFACFSQDEYTVLAGDTVTTQTLKSGTQDVTNGGTDDLEAITGLTVGVYDASWNKVATLTGDGENYSYTFETPGTYYLLALDPNVKAGSACYAPAVSKVTVGSTDAPAQDADGYYLLDDACDMLWLQKYVNIDGNYGVKAALTADVDMTGIPWSGLGTCTDANSGTGVAFTGEFDGRGHTLTVAFTDGALFNCVSGTVKNLTVQGSVSLTGYASGIVSMLEAGGTVDSCVNKASVDCAASMTDKTDYAGGIVWAVFGNATVTNCVNYGAINGGRYYNGGIVGNVRATYCTVTISNCINRANLNVSSRCAGGIVGAFSCNSGTVSDCVNYGNVTALTYAGGVVGELASDSATISECANHGDVVGAGAYAGGITSRASYFQCLIEKCANTGSVTGKTYVGGVIGSGCCEITDCYNTGTITVTGDGSNFCAGGIAGTQAKCQIYNTYTYTGAAISNCYATGTVTKTNASAVTGAVVGVLSSTKDCQAYYLEGVCASGVGSVSEDGTTDSTQSKTSEELKALAATLGDAFVSDTTNLNGGYPILAWQKTVAFGDVNGDGDVNALDAAMAYAFANGKTELTDDQKHVSDVNGDGEINALDAAMIYAYANGKLTQFPAAGA